MTAYWKGLAAAAVLAAAGSPANGWLDWSQAKDFQSRQAEQAFEQRQARDIVAAWPAGVRVLADDMIEEYGTPDEALPTRLTWKERGPWSRIEVYRDDASKGQADNLLQAVSYDAPVGRWRALSALDCGVTYDAVNGQLTARSDSEELNRLALNLADEVIRGRRSPEVARAFYDRTVELYFSGKSSRYTRRLLFKRR